MIRTSTIRGGPRIVRTAMIMGLPFSVHLRRAAVENQPGDRHLGVGTVDVGLADITAVYPTIDAAIDQMWEDLRWADRVFSTYRPDSDISRLRAGVLRIQDADPAVTEVLDLAEIARGLTGGTFDIQGSGVLDPAGIVKGWATARAAARLTELGLDYYLNAGGDVLLSSVRPDDPWRIGIDYPEDPAGLLAVVQLPTGAVATSGRTHRGEHIWNPATGRPAGGTAQATVIGPSLIWADILATAAVAGGVAKVHHRQWPPGHEVLLITDDGAVMISPGFAHFFCHRHADTPIHLHQLTGPRCQLCTPTSSADTSHRSSGLNHHDDLSLART